MRADLRLAIPAAAAWVAAAIVVAVDAWPAAMGLWVAAGVLTLVAARWRAWAIVALAVAAAALCCTSIAAQEPGRHPDLPSSAEVVAMASQTILPGGGSFEVRLTSVDAQRVSTPALVFGAVATERVGIGATISLPGRLVATEPGDDVSFLLFATDGPTVLEPAPWYLEWANALRERFLAQATSLPGAGGDLLAGLAIGDTSAVDESLNAAMKTSSLTHLTAVSGANCAIVIGLIMAAGAALGVSRGVRVGASLVVLAGFVVLVTPQPSVLRAAVMAALVLVALGMGRPVRGLPVLSLAVVALLVTDPWLSRSYGFVLSVFATAGLLLLAGPLARVLEEWMPRWLALVICVPIAAQLSCQPVLILLDASLPTYGVVANLLAAPAAPLATIVGLAACLLLALAPPVGSLLCQLAWLPSAWIAAVAQFFGALPAARLPWPDGALGVGLLAVVTTLGIAAVLTRRRLMVLGLVAVVVAYGSIAGTSHIATQLGRPAWQIAVCDVGQGDAVFVRSRGQIALIDTGREPALLTACLADLGISRIDLLVLTHYDLDHVGGVRAVYGLVDTAFVGPSGEPADDLLVADLVSASASVQHVARGPSGLLGDLQWHVLWPPVRPAGLEPGNEMSVTLEFRAVGACAAGCLSSVFLGDLGQQAQDRVLAANPQLAPVDVVKVSHHGSADQSSEMYERLHAAVGVIGVGIDNGYGHPTDELLGILSAVGTVAERTDESGLILLAPGVDAGTVVVWSER